LADKLGVAWFDRAVGRPVITTPNATRFRVGTPGMFTVNATGTPPLTLTGNGALPGGVVFTPGPDASATLAGTPAAGTDGVYAFTNTASNPTHGATQELTVTVDPAGP
ncbi:MAG TPA: putative Ig domain-containing protein, partial [Acidimicrobiia bacterium]